LENQALHKQFEVDLNVKEEHAKEKRRGLVENLSDLESELKEERKERAEAVKAKKKLEDELKNMKTTLLKQRADYIRTLQDCENISSARITLQIQEIEELRKQRKDFEKCKLADEEEE
jgi:myosin protein heavy chain